MRLTRGTMMGVVALAATTIGLGGCANMGHDEMICKVGTTTAGALLGGLGGGLGVDRVEHEPVTNGERAAGAGAGFAAGALVGYLVGELACPEEEAPPPPPPPPARPQAPPAGTKLVTLHGPEFDFNKATLKPEGRRLVDEAVQVMERSPDMRVSVEGHTDSVGSDAYNMKLGMRRAEAVKSYMVQHGVASDRIATRSFGESRPVAENSTAEGRAKNRRVEIIVQ